MHPRQITILGVGLLGGSIGLAVRKTAPNCKIIGCGHRAATIDLAKKMGAIDEGTADPAKSVAGSDLAILCTPVGLFADLLGQIAPALSRGAIITDVGSTKRSVVAQAEKILPKTVTFVGSHPMAGSEKRGVEFARADLFRGSLCILTPTPQTSPQALQSVEDFWKLLEMRTTRLSPEDHDRLLADASHLPHLIAAALVAVQPDQAIDLCGRGFLDSTRIAAGDAVLWRDILHDNGDNLRQSIMRLQAELNKVLATLTPGGEENLRAWLAAAAEKRIKWGKKGKSE
jgi:prephenate dehydrogenase